MQGILNALDFVVNTIRSVWDFFTGIIEHLILLTKYVAHALVLATQCVLEMPTWLQVFATVTISVSVLYVIVGRDGGKSDG